MAPPSRSATIAVADRLRSLNFSLFSDHQGIVDFDTQIPGSAFQLRVTQQAAADGRALPVVIGSDRPKAANAERPLSGVSTAFSYEHIAAGAYVIEKRLVRYAGTMAELAANDEVKREYLSV